MKRLILMMIPVLICGAVFLGCSEKEPNGEKTADGLYVVGIKSGVVSEDEKTDLVFTGNEIVWFNVFPDVLGGQIFFIDDKVNRIMSNVNLYTELGFFIDNKPVFDPPIRIYHGWVLSHDDFDLQFRYDGYTVFLTDAYMTLDSVPIGERELKQIEIAANKQKRQEELNVLIKYLSDAGKIVERETELPAASSQCEIIAFMDSLHLVNWVINGTNITAVYPAGTDLSSIEPFIVVSASATVSPKSGVKMDFSNEKEVTYTVKAEDGTEKIYKAKARVEKIDGNENLIQQIDDIQLTELINSSTFKFVVYTTILGGMDEYTVEYNVDEKYNQIVEIFYTQINPTEKYCQIPTEVSLYNWPYKTVVSAKVRTKTGGTKIEPEFSDYRLIDSKEIDSPGLKNEIYWVQSKGITEEYLIFDVFSIIGGGMDGGYTVEYEEVANNTINVKILGTQVLSRTCYCASKSTISIKKNTYSKAIITLKIRSNLDWTGENLEFTDYKFIDSKEIDLP